MEYKKKQNWFIRNFVKPEIIESANKENNIIWA